MHLVAVASRELSDARSHGRWTASVPEAIK